MHAPTPETPMRPAGRPRRLATMTALLVGPLVGCALVLQATSAAFTAQTSNPGNSWTAGSVTLTDSQNGTAMFSASGLQPGDSGQRCIRVTYGGSLDAAVKLYAGAATGTLGQYIDLTVQEGTGTAADCSDFTSSATILPTETLETFRTSRISFATGVGTWQPAGGSSAVRTYRIA